MSRQLDAILRLCRLLAAGLLDVQGAVQEAVQEAVREPIPDVAGLIRISSQHLVTPALAWCLRDFVDLDEPAREFFEAVLHLNARRNAVLLAGLARIVGALNAAGIEPMLLKGAAHLAGGLYPVPSLRFLGDLDLLVRPSELHGAAEALKAVGFGQRPDDPVEDSHHHLPMLHEAETGIGVELHGGLAIRPFDRILPAAWFVENASPVTRPGFRAHLPDPTRAVAHNVLHDQLLHHNYRRDGVELRQLLDLALLRQSREGAIDWQDIEDRFARAGHHRVLATYLAFNQSLFGQPAPALRSAPKRDFLQKFDRRAERWPTMRRLASDYVFARRQTPLAAFKLLAPKTWPHRLRRISTAFRPQP